MDSRFHIVYPRGDKTKLSVAEVYPAYELSDYSVASRESFLDEDEANTYCVKLAEKNGLTIEIDGDLYLD